MQNPKFEIFFHMGCFQFLEKNCKNCVHNIITTLEEFIGYFIKIIYFSSNLEDYCVEIIKSLVPFWERKYGAFIAPYPIKFKENKINEEISSEILNSFIGEKLKGKNKLFQSDIPSSSFHLNMILNISKQKKSLKEKLVELKQMKFFMHDSSLPEEWIDFESLKESSKL